MARPAIEVEGLRETLKAFKQLPKDATVAIRDASTRIAEQVAPQIRRAADTEQAKAVAPSVKVRRDRVPAIRVGGARRAGVMGGASYGQLFFGAEFGGRGKPTTQQFRPHQGTAGYWFWPTIRDAEDDMVALWRHAVDDITREWEQG